MLINLQLVSKQCWEKLSNYSININEIDSPVFLELLDALYDLYPQLDPDSDFKLFWQKSSEGFLGIRDWISYNASLKSMGDNSVYMLVNDVERFYRDTKNFLRRLDWEEMRDEKERRRSKYDVKIPGRESTSLEEFEVSSEDSQEDSETEPENLEKEVLVYALRKDPEGKCYTADLILEHNLVHCIKKGWPKLKKKLFIKPDEVIERKKPAKAKSKGSKSSKGGKSKK